MSIGISQVLLENRLLRNYNKFMRLFSFSPTNFVRNITAGDLLENFLISSITTVLVIRFFLFLTDYPQIGGNGLHIAHMLWGGLLMFISIVVLLVFLNRPSYTFASILGGIGFGTFIDELGKFITSENNYFFQPAIAIIYIVFVVLYLFIRIIDGKKVYSKREYLINAIEMIKEAAHNDMDKEEKKLALYYLKQCDQSDPFVKDLRDMLNKAKLSHNPPTTLFTLIKRRMHVLYLILTGTKWFVKATLMVFGISALITLFRSFVYAYGLGTGRVFIIEHPELAFSDIVQLIFSTISAVLVVVGGVIIFRNKLAGFQLLKYSVLISIFFTQVFAFYDHQFEALLGLFGNIFLYLIIQYYITEEESLVHSTED